MKRSEMIKKLQERFDNYDLFDPGTIGEDILKFIEELGMLPPYKSKDRQYPDSLKQHSWTDEKEKDETK